MADRFPLVVNTATSRIAELPAGDKLELGGSDIGNVGNITINGTSNLGSVANVKIAGGTAAYVLSTDGSGNLSWVAQTGGGGGSETFNAFLLAGM